MGKLFLLAVCLVASMCWAEENVDAQTAWEKFFSMPEARNFAISLQENLPELDRFMGYTLFVPENPEDQKMDAATLKRHIVKGFKDSHVLSWAHFKTIDTEESPILWGEPTVSYGELSTVKVAGKYYLVEGKDDKRTHNLVTKPDALAHYYYHGTALAVHFIKNPRPTQEE